jgi:flagellar motor switch protein FliN/FliY
MALNHETKVQLGEIQPVDLEQLASDYPGESVCALAVFTEGFSDELAFILSPRWAAVWADLMRMGDGKAEFSADDHLESIGELLNQVNGIISEGLNGLSDADIKLGEVKTSLEAVESRGEEWESFFRADVLLGVQGFDPGRLTLLLSSQTMQDIETLRREAPVEQDGDPPLPPMHLDDDEAMGEAPEVRAAAFEELGPEAAGGSAQNIDVLMDVELPVVIELGRTSMFIRDILDLGPGSIVELNKLSGEPVDLLINDRKFARGEVVVIDENFGIRITDLVKVEERINTLK